VCSIDGLMGDVCLRSIHDEIAKLVVEGKLTPAGMKVKEWKSSNKVSCQLTFQSTEWRRDMD
jgi:hypothetical protein